MALKFILSFPVPHDDRLLARPFMNRGEVLFNWPINHHLKHGVSVKNIYRRCHTPVKASERLETLESEEDVLQIVAP